LKVLGLKITGTSVSIFPGQDALFRRAGRPPLQQNAIKVQGRAPAATALSYAADKPRPKLCRASLATAFHGNTPYPQVLTFPARSSNKMQSDIKAAEQNANDRPDQPLSTNYCRRRQPKHNKRLNIINEQLDLNRKAFVKHENLGDGENGK
jgi:hypothetical protein